MRPGGRCVITHGQVPKPPLFVDSWDTPDTVSLPATSTELHPHSQLEQM